MLFDNLPMPQVKKSIPRPNLPLLLLQVRERIMARFRPMLNEAGLTEQQWRVLRALLSEGPLEPRQIVSICCLSSASLVGILVRMVDMGLVTRNPVEGDQRRVLVSAAPKGQRLAKRLAPQIDAIYAQIELEMGSDLANNLLGTLDLTLSRMATGEGNDPAAIDKPA